MIKDTKTYTPEELEKILNIKNHTIYTWIKHAIPERLKPKKSYRKELGKKAYQFTDKELRIFKNVKKLKEQGLTYAEIKEGLYLPEEVNLLEPKVLNEEEDPIDEIKKTMRNQTDIILSYIESQRNDIFKVSKLAATTMGMSVSILLLMLFILFRLQ